MRRQRRCGLVHDHDACVAAERTRDLDELLFGHRELARWPIGIDLRPGACEQRLRGPPAARPVDAPPARPTLEPQRQVLRDREMRKQGGLLVDGGDPPIARGERSVGCERRTLNGQRPRVGLDGARENPDQRGLAGAVLADDGVHLAGPEVERHVPEGLHARVGLRQSLCPQQLVRLAGGLRR